MRVVVDCRPANCCFADPPPLSLPSPSSFSLILLADGDSLWFGKHDLADSFYQLRLPDWMPPCFGLPSLSAAALAACGIGVGGLGGGGGGELWLVLPVVPMGWLDGRRALVSPALCALSRARRPWAPCAGVVFVRLRVVGLVCLSRIV